MSMWDLYYKYMFNFKSSCQTVFLSGCPILHSKYLRVRVALLSCQHSWMKNFCFVCFSHSDRQVLASIGEWLCGFNLHFPKDLWCWTKQIVDSIDFLFFEVYIGYSTSLQLHSTPHLLTYFSKNIETINYDKLNFPPLYFQTLKKMLSPNLFQKRPACPLLYLDPSQLPLLGRSILTTSFLFRNVDSFF